MIIEEPLNAEDANETKWAGVGVILICWVPGIVAILHLIASHKYTYICLSYKSILCSFSHVCPKALKGNQSQIRNANKSIRDEFLFLGESVSKKIRKVCSNGHKGTDFIANKRKELTTGQTHKKTKNTRVVRVCHF